MNKTLSEFPWDIIKNRKIFRNLISTRIMERHAHACVSTIEKLKLFILSLYAINLCTFWSVLSTGWQRHCPHPLPYWIIGKGWQKIGEDNLKKKKEYKKRIRNGPKVHLGFFFRYPFPLLFFCPFYLLFSQLPKSRLSFFFLVNEWSFHAANSFHQKGQKGMIVNMCISHCMRNS